MYEINSIDGRKFINGYKIMVIGKGDDGACEIRDANDATRFCGTYAECEKWLLGRALLVK